MILLNFILFLFIIFTTNMVGHVMSLYVEGINGGLKIESQRIPYHVGILTQHNSTTTYTLICSGGIIAEKLILTAARCFVNNHGILPNYTYSVTASTNNWVQERGIVVLIDLIYLPGDGNYYLNDVSVAKLEKKLAVFNNPKLGILEIPFPEELFFGRMGIVSGYGYHWFIMMSMLRSNIWKRMNGGTDHSLRYAEVLISVNSNCSTGYRSIDKERKFCGKMLVDDKLEPRGICDDDLGAPLVIDNKVVGLAGLQNEYCDDTDVGSTYTKVSNYAPFIESIIMEKPLPDVVVLRNKMHILKTAAAAA